MKLAIVSPYPPEISGVGQYGLRLSHGLADSGAFEAITVLANRAPAGGLAASAPADRRLSVRRVWARDWPGSAPALLLELGRLAPDVVWFNLGLSAFGGTRWANLLGLAMPALARARGSPSVVTLHEIFEAADLRGLGAANGRLTTLGGQVVTRLLLRADVVCLTLRRYVAEIRRRYQATNLAHVPVGSFDPPEMLPWPCASRNVLMFATFAPFKGLPLMLDAFAGVLRQDASAGLTVAGGDHPRFPGYLHSVRAARARQPNVRWLGPVPEAGLRDLFAAASLVALPYAATTGASSVIHRAAAYGRPVVVSDLPDSRALAAEEGLWLEFVPPGDRAALAEAVAGLLADSQRREAMARHNLAAMQAMTLEHTCRSYLALFRQAACRSAGARRK
jgi:glycosyltransferase involved in cell wall biosynthesis